MAADAADYVKLQPLPKPLSALPLSPDETRFKSFKKGFTQEEPSRIAAVAFTACLPNRLAVASGTKVRIWRYGKEQGSMELEATVTKFKNVTTCVSWRNDGKLLMAGEAGGSTAVIETDTRKILRRFRSHNGEVSCAVFAHPDKTRAATGGRDGDLRIWDVVTAELVALVNAHGDVVKAVVQGSGPDAWITCGYDAKVKLWDLQLAAGNKDAQPKCTVERDHGSPIEVGISFPGGALFATAGGTSIKVWDLAIGGTLAFEVEGAHSKTITSLCLSADATFLLTAAFDGYAKVYRTVGLEFRHIWTFKLGAAATSVSWRPDSRAFVVGLETGAWQMRLQKASLYQAEGKEKTAEETMEKNIDGDRPKRTFAMKKSDARPVSDDEVFEPTRKKKKKENPIDFAMRKFDYRKALELMVRRQVAGAAGFAVLEEMLERCSLHFALGNLGEELCLAMLSWLHRSFVAQSGLQQQIWFEALFTLIENNQALLTPPRSPELYNAMKKVEEKVSRAARDAETLEEITSMLEVAMGCWAAQPTVGE